VMTPRSSCPGEESTPLQGADLRLNANASKDICSEGASAALLGLKGSSSFRVGSDLEIAELRSTATGLMAG
jgi:hypothetical protein